MATATSVWFIFANLPGLFSHPISLFDEGARLAGGGFLAKGALIYRDYYSPYGPGRDLLGATLRWVGLDSVLAGRLLFFCIATLSVGMLTFVATRRRGIYVGAFMAVIATVFVSYDGGYGESNTVVLLLVATALAVLEEGRFKTGGSVFRRGGPASDKALLSAGILIGLTAWFRVEFAIIVALYVGLTLVAGREREHRVSVKKALVPLMVGAAPYAAVVLGGGLENLMSMIWYAVDGYPEFRAAEAPYSRLQFARHLFDGDGAGLRAWTVALSSTASIGLSVLLIDRVVAAGTRSSRFSLFRSEDSDSWTIIIGVAVLIWFSTRVRPDVFHLSQLVVPLWLAFVWNPLRIRLIEPVVGVGVVLLTIVTSGFFGVGRWNQLGDTISSEYPNHRFNGLKVDEQIAVDLASIQDAWEQDSDSEVLFVANRSNDITGMSAPLVYYVLDAKPAHWLTMFDPGFADQSNHQASMIDALCDTRAPVVLLETPRFRELEGLSFSQDLDRFIALNYDIQVSTVTFDYRVSSRDQCITPPDVKEASALQDRIDQLMTAGDLTSVDVLRSWQRNLASADSAKPSD